MGQCVEWAVDGDSVYVRDSKQNGRPDQPVLRFTAAEWAAFTQHFRNQ